MYGREISLAPAYDLVSTHVHDDLSHDMAMSINGMFDSRAPQAIHWRKELDRLGLNERCYAQRLAELADRTERALPAALDRVQARGLSDRRLETIADLVRTRAKVLRALPGLVEGSKRGGGAPRG
jgi:hypothetical protein